MSRLKRFPIGHAIVIVGGVVCLGYGIVSGNWGIAVGATLALIPWTILLVIKVRGA